MQTSDNAEAEVYAAKLREALSARNASMMATTCARPSLRERVSIQLSESTSAAARSGRLSELQRLLEANPDVARILDLIEEVRG